MRPTVRGLSWKGYEGEDYEQFWTGPGKQFLDRLERAIVSEALTGGDTIVDVGAGFGRLADCYVGKYRSVHMVEPAGNLREIAQRKYGKAASYHDASVEALPFETESIDAVLMVRVFHHLENPDKGLLEIHRVLKRGGKLVFNYSNKRNLKRIARYVLGRGKNPLIRGMEQYDPILIGHHPDDVDDLLRTVGFQIERQYATGTADKLINAIPPLRYVTVPSSSVARLFGSVRLAPAQFVIAQKR